MTGVRGWDPASYKDKTLTFFGSVASAGAVAFTGLNGNDTVVTHQY